MTYHGDEGVTERYTFHEGRPVHQPADVTQQFDAIPEPPSPRIENLTEEEAGMKWAHAVAAEFMNRPLPPSLSRLEHLTDEEAFRLVRQNLVYPPKALARRVTEWAVVVIAVSIAIPAVLVGARITVTVLEGWFGW